MSFLKSKKYDNAKINHIEMICLQFHRPSLTRKTHGGCAGLLRCGKGTTWEGGQRVPGFISYPGHIEPGRSHSLVSTLDMMPTIMSIVGAHFNASSEGVSYDLSDLLFRNGKVRTFYRIITFRKNVKIKEIRVFPNLFPGST